MTWLHAKPVQRVGIALALLLAAGVAVSAFVSMESNFGVQILAPATVPPVGQLCTEPLNNPYRGHVSPLFCDNGDINTTAWKLVAETSPAVMTLGRNATPRDVGDAAARDIRSYMSADGECDALELSAAYYGWTFHIDPVSGLALSCPVMR